jgi:NitT/TauT family transport system substrate-binding protein
MRTVAALFLVAALSAGCNGTPPSGRTVDLKVFVTPRLSFAPLYIAKADGHFARHGLNVELVEMARSVDAIAALGQGRLDVAGGTMNAGLLNAIARGVPIRIVADKGYASPDDCTSYAIVGARPWKKELVTAGPAPLRSSADPTQFTGFMLDRQLATAGFSLADVTTVDVPEPIELQALQQGQVDVVTVGEPWLGRIVNSGSGHVWGAIEDIMPNAQIGSIWFGPTLLETNREAGRRFMAAYLDAVRQYQEGATPRNLEIVSMFTGLDVSQLTDMCWPVIRLDGRVNIDSVREFHAWIVARGGLDRGAATPAERFVDPSFAEWASAQAAH